MAYGRNYDKAINKKKWAELVRIPKTQETLDSHWKSLFTPYSALSLGVGTDGECTVNQEERENHFHILGTTGEGKSMLLLRMVMEDIKRIVSKENGPGLVFIDGSEGGDTIRKILGFCEQIKFKRVLLIDPNSRFAYQKITPLNPIHSEKSLIDQSSRFLMQAFRAVFGVKEAGQNAIIEDYLPLMFRSLAEAEMTLGDLDAFTDFSQERKRGFIMSKVHNEYALRRLGFAYNESPLSLSFKELGSTMRRVGTVFRDEGLRLMLSHHKGIDFTKLITDRWVVLVNVSDMDVLQGRLLSSLVINELIFALKRLGAHGWKGCEYLYIDEVARYGTQQLTDILEQMRKIGLRLILSHQHMGQFDDLALAKAIRTQTKTKIAFYVADREERDQVVRMMYGGELSDREVSYALSQQEKRNAVVKLNKIGAKIIRTHDTPEFNPSKEFIQSIYNNPWYYTENEITKGNEERFSGQNNSNPGRTAQSHQRTTSHTNQQQNRHSPKEHKKDVPKGGSQSKKAPREGQKWEDLLVEIEGGQDKGTDGTEL